MKLIKRKYMKGRVASFIKVIAVNAFAISSLNASNPPNIILIFADDLGYGEIGPYGQTLIRTPNLDQMASEGVKLTDFYANSICAPSRASLITGLSLARSPIRDNYELGSFLDEEEFGQMPLPSGIYTIGKQMQNAGYKTSLIGKWGLGGIGSTGVPWQQGFDHFFGYLDQKQAHNFYPTHLWRNDQYVELPNKYLHPHQSLPAGMDPHDDASYKLYKGKAYSNDLMTDEAVQFILENKNNPFFLTLGYTIPHVALQVPDEALIEYIGLFEEKPYTGGSGYLPHRYPRSCYAAMITRLDGYIGRIFHLLKEMDIDNNTLVIFTSDNGPSARGGADPYFFKSTGGFKGMKGSLYEGGIRVPFIARWPDNIKPGTESSFPAAFWDFLPTFAEIAKIEVAEHVDGISILPVLKGAKQSPVEREYLYWEAHRGGRGSQAVRFNGHWKMIRSNMHGEGEMLIELYNLKDDPYETKNIAVNFPDKIIEAVAFMDLRQTAVINEWNFFRLK